MNQATLSTVLTDLLDAIEDAYTASTLDVPVRSFVAWGTGPSWQGEELIVYMTGFRPVAPHPLTQIRAPKGNVVPAIDCMVEVVRDCYPLPQASAAAKQLADPTKIQAAALALAEDAAVVGGFLTRMSVELGLLDHFPTIGLTMDVASGPLVPTGPLGQFAGFKVPVSIALTAP